MVGAVGFDDFDEFSYNTMQQQEFASSVDCKTRAVFSEKMKPMKARGSGELGGKMKWGGKNGVEFSGYLEGEIRDDKGNYAKGEVEQNSDGTGSAKVAAGHEESFQKYV